MGRSKGSVNYKRPDRYPWLILPHSEHEIRCISLQTTRVKEKPISSFLCMRIKMNDDDWSNSTSHTEGRKEGNVLFNDALNTFYLRLYGVRHHMVKDHSDREREETRCRRLAARVLLYASSHRHDNTYHGLYDTSRGALAGTRNSSVGPS